LITHVLLTRSPLSPGPKARFSLDLHVLSAPPAFVLSQDQTLREELIAAKIKRSSGKAGRDLLTGTTSDAFAAIFFTLSLCSKSIPRNRDVTGSFVSSPAPKGR
jgi:hypothetical protein